jgi:hypothetical protein
MKLCHGVQAAIHHFTNHLLSTFRAQLDILVRSILVVRESLRFANISVPSSVQMDNLLDGHL